MSSGKGSKTSSSTQTISGPQYLDNDLQYGAQQAQNLYQAGVPAYYSGQQYAPFDPLQTQAMNTTVNLADNPNSLVTSANNYTQNTLDTPSGQNPYLAAIVGQAANNANTQVASEFNGSGRLGSGANVSTAAKAITNAQLPFLFNQYNADQQNKNTAVTNAEALQQIPFTNAARVATVGGANQQMAQNQINQDMAAWQYNSQGPQNLLQNFLNSIYASPANKDTTTSGSTTQTSDGGFGSILSGALGLASMFTPMGALGGLGTMMGSGLGSALGSLGGILSGTTAAGETAASLS